MDEAATTDSEVTRPAPLTMSKALYGLNELLKGKQTLAAAHGISAAALDSIYSVARELYANGHKNEALRSFELLCLYDHENARNWHALGICRKASRDYLGAAAALAFAIGETDVLAHQLHLELIECLVAAGQWDAAAARLGQLFDAADAGSADEAWLARAGFLRAQLDAIRRNQCPQPQPPASETNPEL